MEGDSHAQERGWEGREKKGETVAGLETPLPSSSTRAKVRVRALQDANVSSWLIPQLCVGYAWEKPMSCRSRILAQVTIRKVWEEEEEEEEGEVLLGDLNAPSSIPPLIFVTTAFFARN